MATRPASEDILATAAGADVTLRAAPAHIEPNLRRLRMYLAVVDCGSTHKAAEKLHLTQSSLTKAVQELEREAGIALFERTHKGMIATECGVILASRARRALSHLEAAEQEVLEAFDDAEPAHSAAVAGCKGFAGKVTHRQLAALTGIANYQTETSAAQHLCISQPAVTLALRGIEQLVGKPLFLRTARGMIATVFGEILVRRAKLAFSEIIAATNDMSSHLGLITGRVVVGALPLSGALIAPRAINLLLLEHPQLQVSVVDGTFRSLIQGVRCGDIDVIIGALEYPTPACDIIKEHLFDDELSIVVRKDHPLTRKKNVTLADLAHSEWVVPRTGTPARMYLDQVMKAAGMGLGVNPIESNALLTVRALLMESDRLSIISRHQIYFEESADLLRTLPVDMGASVPIGVGTRADGSPSAGVKAFLRHLHSVSEAMAGTRH